MKRTSVQQPATMDAPRESSDAPADSYIAGERADMAKEDQKRSQDALEKEDAKRVRTPYRDSPLRPPPRR